MPRSQDSTLFALPNLLTYARIVAIPVVVMMLVIGDPALRWAALVLYVLAAFTDWLDGYLARRWQLISPLGRMLDPIADKLLVGALIVTFAWDGTLGPWELTPALAILLREIFVSGLREFLGPMNVVIHVTRLAKWKTTVQMVALAALFAAPLVPLLQVPTLVLLWLAGALTIVTGWQYLVSAWPHLKGE